ncbi:MAG: hypothetical protein GY835_21635 [bacterium]|nr:hypothetical protein [bacterium]
MRIFAATVCFIVLGLSLALMGGCGDSIMDGHTWPTLISINEGIPVYSDVWVVDTTLAGGGYIPQEAVTFKFTNSASQRFLDITPDDPYGNFILTSFTISYEVVQYLDAGGVITPGTLPTVSGAMNLVLPVGSEVETSMMIAPAAIKLENPVLSLFPGGAAPAGEVIVVAEVLFLGHEQGSDHVQEVSGGTTILFANYGDED